MNLKQLIVDAKKEVLLGTMAGLGVAMLSAAGLFVGLIVITLGALAGFGWVLYREYTK